MYSPGLQTQSNRRNGRQSRTRLQPCGYDNEVKKEVKNECGEGGCGMRRQWPPSYSAAATDAPVPPSMPTGPVATSVARMQAPFAAPTGTVASSRMWPDGDPSAVPTGPFAAPVQRCDFAMLQNIDHKLNILVANLK
jgi:hypothetical protein